MIKYSSYRDYQRYRCRGCEHTANDKTGRIFAQIGLDQLLFAFYSLLRFNTSVCQIDIELDVSYRSFYWCVEQFARTLDATIIDLVGPVDIDIYVSAGKKAVNASKSRSRMACQNVIKETTTKTSHRCSFWLLTATISSPFEIREQINWATIS